MADTLEDVVIKEICKTGDKTNILPEDTPSGSNKLSYNDGIPITTSIPERDGGIPPERKDFNKVFNLITKKLMFLQNGGGTFFDQNVANAIGGYPLGAILSYSSGNNYYKIKSLIDNNIYPPTNENTKTPISPEGTYFWEKLNDRALFPSFIELFPSSSQANNGGHIDFHYNQSAEDYTSRIIEDEYRKLNLVCANGLKVNGYKQRSLIETSSGSSSAGNWWLDKYDDGYIEQGGIIYTSGNTGLGDIYFPNPINNVENMIAVPGLLGVDTTTSLDNFLGIRIYELTTTYMRVKTFYAKNGSIGRAGGIQVSWWIKGK